MPDTPVSGFYTAADVHLDGVLDREGADVVTPNPDPSTCEYTHFDLSSENLGGTKRYNCWGFTFLPRRYWLGRTDVDNIIRDNCDPVADGSVQVGDVIRYRDDLGVTQHTGRVWSTDGAGHATEVRSKWGQSAERFHAPLNVPSIYGANLAYFRQRLPLKGDPGVTGKIADLWIKDSPVDNGEQYSVSPWWTSPDIMVDVPPYDGTPDLNPVFNSVNRVWATVRNRTNQPAENVYVRYYWADPSAGLAPANWQLIPGTPGHPNPAGPISIGPNSSAQAGYVEWTPTASPAHQCLLAIAYINDNPRDSTNPDPLVYSFDVPWENNIAQRNVHILPLEEGENGELSIGIGTPIRRDKRIRGDVQAVLTYSPRLPILGFPKVIAVPKVRLRLGKKKWFDLTPLKSGVAGEKQHNKKSFESPVVLDIKEKVVAWKDLPGLIFTPGRSHRLDIEVSVTNGCLRGSLYYLHIIQKASGAVTGGYTVVIAVE